MNTQDRYGRFALCREMLETVEVVRRFDAKRIGRTELASDTVLLTGEGSSRIFPAKRAIAHSLREGWPQQIVTESATQALEYDLSGYHVFIASNSGKTAEGVHLIRALRREGAKPIAAMTGVVAHGGTPIAEEADDALVLDCGGEDAVAATKSVVEQALVYDTLFRAANGSPGVDRDELADALHAALTMDLNTDLVRRIASSPVLYFSGRNDGVAEELTLKTNEITRKRSDFLEGTYAVHGIEEVMQRDETVIVIDPFPHQEEKFASVLKEGVGMNVVAIGPRETIFPTITVPDAGTLLPYVLLAAGWNLLVEVGLSLTIDLDTPQRARKVGNEFVG